MNICYLSILSFFCIIFLVSCQNDSNLSEDIVGEWHNISMNVQINTANNTELNNILDVKEGEWEQTLKIKPIRTIYNQDGTFHSEYRNMQDSILNKQKGNWKTEGDTLYLIFGTLRNKYHTKIEGNIGTFTGLLDWDRDGKEDDIYFGKQKKID